MIEEIFYCDLCGGHIPKGTGKPTSGSVDITMSAWSAGHNTHVSRLRINPQHCCIECANNFKEVIEKLERIVEDLKGSNAVTVHIVKANVALTDCTSHLKLKR